MPYMNQANWLLEMGDYYEKMGVDIFSLRDKITDLQVDFLDNKEKKYRLEIWAEIAELMKQLNYFVSGEGVYYNEANVFDNIVNVGLKYIEDEYRTTPKFIFDVEMLNRRVMVVSTGFYPKLDPNRHTYIAPTKSGLHIPEGVIRSVDNCKYDGDLMDKAPLIIAPDWGSKICCITIAQDHGMEYKMINDLHVLHPGLVKELAAVFIKYYEPKVKKEVILLPDPWGKTFKDPDNKKTYNETFESELSAGGWEVTSEKIGKIPSHTKRYLEWQKVLSELDSRYPVFRFNRINCKWTLLAMSQAKTRDGMKGEIKKDKSDERKDHVDQRGTTHFTDTVDMHMVYKLKKIKKSFNGFVDTSVR